MPLHLLLPARWLVATDLRGSLKPTGWVLLGLLLTDAYLLAVLNAPPGYITPIPLFLPQAVILSTLLLIPRRRWALPLAVYYVYLVLHGIWRSNPPGYVVVAEVADIIYPLLAAVLLARLLPGPLQFRTLQSVWEYSAVVILGAMVAATWGATTRVLLIGAPFGDFWSRWFFSDVLASLVVAPMIVLWAQAGRAGLRLGSRTRGIELAALGGAFWLLALLQLSSSGGDDTEQALRRYLPISLLVWAAVRFGPRGLLTALSSVLVLSIAVVSRESAPSTAANVTTLQMFLLTVGVPLFGLAALMQERQEGRDRLEQSEAQYHAVVASLPHGAVLLFGPDLRHFFADGQGLPRLGLSKGGIEGKALGECFPFEIAALLEPHYRAALAGTHHAFELSHEGRTYQAEVQPVTMVDRPAAMLLLQDVTPARLVTELTAANEQLELANRAQSELVSDMSHEFRTPLSSIQAFSELIRDEQLHLAERKEFSGYINQEALRLSRLVSDLLDLNSADAGRMALHPELLDVNALVEEVVATQRRSAPQHEVWLDLEPELPAVVGDRDRLAQVVLNLVSNAIKYSPAGGEITLGTSREGQGIHLWVRDEGIGISPENLERIFERYTRVATEEHPAIQGLGLGLPIVRHIAELHGGRVWAESETGSGSTFHLTLPIAFDAQAA